MEKTLHLVFTASRKEPRFSAHISTLFQGVTVVRATFTVVPTEEHSVISAKWCTSPRPLDDGKRLIQVEVESRCGRVVINHTSTSGG